VKGLRPDRLNAGMALASPQRHSETLASRTPRPVPVSAPAPPARCWLLTAPDHHPEACPHRHAATPSRGSGPERARATRSPPGRAPLLSVANGLPARATRPPLSACATSAGPVLRHRWPLKSQAVAQMACRTWEREGCTRSRSRIFVETSDL